MIAVRVLRDGHAVREVVLRSLPASIGRAADADLPLFDRSVSRRHAQLEADAQGQIWLVDLGSQNGIQAHGAYVERMPLGALTRCRFGNLELELETLDPAATAVLPRSPMPAPSGRGALHPLPALALGALALATAAGLDPWFWSPTQESRLVLLSALLLVVVLLLPLLATGLFVVLKVFGRPLRWAHALQTLALLLWTLPALALLSLLAYYVLSAQALERFDELAGLGAVVLTVVVMAGVRRSPPNRRFRLAWGMGTLLVLLAIRAIAALSAYRQGEPALDFRVQAPLGGWPGATQPMAAYEARVRAMADDARRAADEVRVTQQRE